MMEIFTRFYSEKKPGINYQGMQRYTMVYYSTFVVH